jgi:hypothetical protein
MDLIMYVKSASPNGKCARLGASGENVDNGEL